MRFNGIRPHVQAAAGGTGVAPGHVEQLRSIKELNNLLCQAVAHAENGKLDVAKTTLAAAKKSLVELEVAHEAGLEAFTQVEDQLGVKRPIIPPVETHEELLSAIATMAQPGERPLETFTRLQAENTRLATENARLVEAEKAKLPEVTPPPAVDPAVDVPPTTNLPPATEPPGSDAPPFMEPSEQPSATKGKKVK